MELGVSVGNRGLSEPLFGIVAELQVDLVCDIGTQELVIDDSVLEYYFLYTFI